ncbi:MAG: PEP-CTERM sorting domain-containing protein [Roseibacillus sp.]
MKNTLIPALLFCSVIPTLSQSLDSVPTDATGFTLSGPPSWSWTDAILGTVTATYLTDNDTTRNAYRELSSTPFAREGFFAYRNNPNGVTDITGTEQLVFSWDNPVNSLEVAIGDFDENNAGTAALEFTGDVTGVALGDIGEQPADQGYTYSTTASTLTLDTRGPLSLGLDNGKIYNSIDVVLTGTGMTTFTVDGVSTNINALEIGGITAVPEPSTTLLGALAGLGLLARRRR